jgi:hypothetical protein
MKKREGCHQEFFTAITPHQTFPFQAGEGKLEKVVV